VVSIHLQLYPSWLWIWDLCRGSKTLEAKARLGLVPAMKEGKSWLFRLSLLDQYIDRQLKSNVTNHAALAPNRKDQEP
jgi:hypothetical protein